MQVNMEISPSGRLLRLTHSNGRIIAEILIHGPLRQIVDNCESDMPIVRGRPNIFRGELFGLAGYEILDTASECIKEK